jgi:hypothetical protein
MMGCQGRQVPQAGALGRSPFPHIGIAGRVSGLVELGEKQ